MKYLFLFMLAFCVLLSAQNPDVKIIDFLQRYDLEYNGAGPLFVKVDVKRNRIIVPHTLSSAVSIIDGKTHKATNIPLKARIPQHLKAESLHLDEQSGHVYIIGDHCLHVVDPDKKSAKLFPTKQQYEMAAVDALTGHVFLVGRESAAILTINPSNGEQHKIDWVEYSEPLVNLNLTPPPPIRKVFVDHSLRKLIALDGFTSTLHFFDVDKLTKENQKKLSVDGSTRWHLAGYNKNNHCLYLVVETGRRKVTHAVRYDLLKMKETIIELPQYTEGVGINYNPKLDEVYIPYDNYPSVHVVDFKNEGKLYEIKLPLYGNDASAIDMKNDRLFIACWAFGEIEIIDLKSRKFIDRIPDLGIIPHMFTMDFNPKTGKLYFPKGATAVNGTFGSAITSVDVKNGSVEKVYTGWAPVDLIERSNQNDFLVFNSEDEMAILNTDGLIEYHSLPCDYPHQAAYAGNGNIYLSYGPHQSYWPNVYIWGARNGIVYLDQNTLHIRDRRIPRLAQQISVDKNGVLYGLQNSWGAEQQFLTVLEDEVREFDAGKRIILPDTVHRETIQRNLVYDESMHRLYLLKTGETDDLPGKLQIINLEDKKQLAGITTLQTPTDLIFDDHFIYVANFDSDTVMRVDKKFFSVEYIPVGRQPLKLGVIENKVFILNHGDNTLQRIESDIKSFKIPGDGLADGLFIAGKSLYISSHSKEKLIVHNFDTENESFRKIIDFKYPYGDTSFDTNNSSFFLRGQFGDCIYDLTRFKTDEEGRVWVIDFLSGRGFILK